MSSSATNPVTWPERRWHGLLACLLLSWLFTVPACHATDWHNALPQVQPSGNGELRWFGFRIYSATLWSSTKPFDPSKPFALELTYARSISRARLVQTSIEEIRRLSGQRYSEQQYSRWQQQLENTFIDVSAGDQLIGVCLPGVGISFYNRTGLLANIPDPELAQAFFNIWLDPHTKDAQLREQLVGSK